jgi:ferredoxin-type protein NapH
MPLPLTTRRRIVQGASLALLNSNVFGSAALARCCLPLMNCEACAVAWLGCPIGMIGRSVAFREMPWAALLLVLGIGAVAGRLLCGWVCPMGFLQDLLHKLPSRKWRLPRWTGAIKYAVLAATVFGVAWLAGCETPGFYCSFCPTSGLQVVLPIMIADRDWLFAGMRAVKMSFLVAVLVGGVLINRGFCKVVCPVGALVAIGNRLTPLRLRLDAGACIGCRRCDRNCPMDVPVTRHRRDPRPVNRDPECIACLRCKEVCPPEAMEYGVSLPSRRRGHRQP